METEPIGLRVKASDKGLVDDITPNGIMVNRHFDFEIENAGALNISWFNVDMVGLFQIENSKSNVSETIVDGNTKINASNYLERRVIHNKVTCKFSHPIKPGEKLFFQNVKIQYFNDKDHNYVKSFVYQIYGALEGGGTFKRLQVPEIKFNERGYAEEVGFDRSPCFIATAVFNDSSHTIVNDYRRIRDEILRHHHLGRCFIMWYEQYGPSLANRIRSRNILKSVVKIILSMAWIFVRVFLDIRSLVFPSR